VLAARRKDRLESLAKEIEARGVSALVVECDVRHEADVDALVAATLERFGRVDVLVNSAGTDVVTPAELETVEEFERVIGVNLVGTWLCAQRFGRVMLEAQSGCIVNIASVLGLVASGQVPQVGYVASKGGVVQLTRELATQWARRGVRVNAIAPGWFATEMTEEMFSTEAGLRFIRRRTPMGRAGEGHELVGALLFLASDASSYVTGQIIPVDGGWTTV
jgi:NAD(P)-dependent dehydrogenase (short-subunit alcohol dehydrogenase family)